MKIKTLAAAAALTLGSLGVASSASAAGPVVTGGLVNVTIVDLVDANNNEILNDVNIGAALQLAANVCDVNVNVLARQLPGEATCTNGDQVATIVQR